MTSSPSEICKCVGVCDCICACVCVGQKPLLVLAKMPANTLVHGIDREVYDIIGAMNE